MLANEDEYLAEKAKEQQLPEDTPREDIPVDDPDAGLNILMSIVGVKPGRQICGLRNGRLRDIRESSSNVRRMEKELEAERAARMAADAALMKTEQRMQKKLKVAGQKFNATLQSWHQSMLQLYAQIPGLVLPPFMPFSMEDDDNEDEEDDFG